MELEFRLGAEALFTSRLSELQAFTCAPFAVFTNFTGINRAFLRTIDLLLDAEHNPFAAQSAVNFKKILSAEHGLYGTAQAGVHVGNAVDARTGRPIISLYGPQKKPSPELLQDVETIFFEFQDVGLRCYTYLSSLYYLLEAAHEQRKRVVVLDRPNPLGGVVVEGGGVDEAMRSFVSIASIPMRHGLTFGELARLFCAENGWDQLELVVCTMEGWQREMWWEQTGLRYVPPSPNLPTPDTLAAYCATVYVEGTELSEGRGTTKPFEWVGAPWLDGEALADRLNRTEWPGVLFRPVRFEPQFSKQAGQVCQGVQMYVTDRAHFSGASVGLHLLDALRCADPVRFKWWVYNGDRHFIDLLFGSQQVRHDFERGRPVAEVLQEWTAYSAAFQKRRESCLYY